MIVAKKQKNEKNLKLSYESDGVMGNNPKGGKREKRENEFFNITPSSE
jgi:hypothetical protein